MRARRREPTLLVVDELPEGPRETVEAMIAGQEVDVLRGDVRVGVATFRSTVAEGAVSPSPDHQQPPAGVTVVASAVPLGEDGRRRLSEQLGESYVVLDVDEAPDTAEVLLIHPVSPQLIGLLGHRFRQARIIVTEVDDEDLDVHHGGGVSRLLDAGATAYLPPRPLDEVARGVRTFLETSRAPQLTRGDEEASGDARGGLAPGDEHASIRQLGGSRGSHAPRT